MFRVSLRMAWGSPSTAKTWNDLNRREWTYLLLPAVLVLWIGLAPAPFLRLIDPSIDRLLADLRGRAPVKEAPLALNHADAVRHEPPAVLASAVIAKEVRQ